MSTLEETIWRTIIVVVQTISLLTILSVLTERAVVASTRFIEYHNLSLSSGESYTLMDEDGAGEIVETQVKSSSSSFAIKINVDGTDVFDKTYSDMRVIQQSSPSVSAFEERDESGNLTGLYVALLKKISYKKSIKIYVVNTSATPILVNNIFIKYHVISE